MRAEPSAEPEFTELQIVGTPVYSFTLQSTQRAALDAVASSPATASSASPSSDKILVGAWDAGFCSCLNFVVPNTFMSWCCPWVSIAQIASRLGIYPFAKTLLAVLALHIVSWASIAVGLSQRRYRAGHPEEDGLLYLRLTAAEMHGYLSSWYCLGFVCTVVYIVGVWQLRGRVRERFQISGSWGADLVAAACCSCCTVAQIATHVKSYTPGSCNFGPPVDTLPAYP